MAKKYAEKFKDPRWQKKRLEVLERDEWMCQQCFETTETLHIHHKAYEKGKYPWEYDNKYMITLCESCHEDETNTAKDIFDNLVKNIKINFLSQDAINISLGFYDIKMVHSPATVAAALCFFLSDEKRMSYIVEEFLKDCHGE